MRLTCPNCGAEYEVPDGLVPEDGRHVQCTSCQTRWYVYGGTRAIPSQDQIIHRLEQWRPSVAPTAGAGPRPVDAQTPPSPATAEEPAEDAGEADGAVTPAAASDAGTPPAAAHAEPPAQVVMKAQAEPAAPQPSDAAAGDDAKAQASDIAAPAKPAETPTASDDPDIAAIIALKRARDRERRTSADAAVAAPSPLHDDTPPPRPAALPDAPPVAAAARVRQSPRMELPNSETMPRAIWADSPEELQARYRSGLFLALLLYALALAAYLWSDDLARIAPGIGAVLEAYAAGVDGLRVWLSEVIARVFGGRGA